MISIRESDPHKDSRFIDECYDMKASFYGRNQYDVKSIMALPSFIVHKGNKDIGMFINFVNEYSSEVVCEFYKHPRACSFASLSVAKVGLIRSALLILDSDGRYSNTFMDNALGARIAGRLLPFANIVKLEDDLYSVYFSKDLIGNSKNKIDVGFFNFSEFDKETLTFSIDI